MSSKESSKLSLTEEDESFGWMLTYADLMTLLLVFFILLFSISSLNSEKFKYSMKSIQDSLQNSIAQTGMSNVVIDRDGDKYLEEMFGVSPLEKELFEDFKNFIEKKELNENVDIERRDNKIILKIKGNMLFPSGAAVINYSAQPVLDQLIEIFKDYKEFNINIKGHTDNLPINTPQFPSNWELSAIRATSVLRYLIHGGIAAERLTATGYGDSMPLVRNDTEENRAKNRRVEFVLEKKEDIF